MANWQLHALAYIPGVGAPPRHSCCFAPLLSNTEQCRVRIIEIVSQGKRSHSCLSMHLNVHWSTVLIGLDHELRGILLTSPAWSVLQGSALFG